MRVQQRGSKSLYAYPMGRHNLDLFVDPWRFSRSLPLINFGVVELGKIDRSLHQTLPFGKPRVFFTEDFAVASYDRSCSERNKNTKEKQPARKSCAVYPFWHFLSLIHALGAFASLRVSVGAGLCASVGRCQR